MVAFFNVQSTDPTLSTLNCDNAITNHGFLGAGKAKDPVPGGDLGALFWRVIDDGHQARPRIVGDDVDVFETVF